MTISDRIIATDLKLQEIRKRNKNKFSFSKLFDINRPQSKLTLLSYDISKYKTLYKYSDNRIDRFLLRHLKIFISIISSNQNAITGTFKYFMLYSIL